MDTFIMNRLALSALLFSLPIAALADGEISGEAKEGLTTTVSMGATLADGNSETVRINAGFLTEGEVRNGTLRYGVEIQYGEDTVDGVSDTTVENGKASINYKRGAEENFVYVHGAAMRDDITEVEYRAGLGPGVGRYLLKNEKTISSAEIGVSYVWEDVAGVEDDYPALRLAQQTDHKLSATSKIWQSVEYIPRSDEFSDYLLNAELGAQAALNAHMHLRVVVQNKYDSVPAPGLEKNDLVLIAGFGLKL